MERIVRGRSATLSHTFYSDATATDPSPDSATVTVVRLSTGATVTTGSVNNSGTGVVTVTIPASQNTLLDTYTMTWTATFGGESQTFVDTVEVAGGTLFSVAEARALLPDAVAYPTSVIVAMRTTVEEAIEEACGVAFVPRYALETFGGDGCTTLDARWPLAGYLSSTNIPLMGTIRSVTVDGATVDPSTVIADRFEFYNQAGWSQGRRNITIGYEHGAKYPPDYLKRAALIQAKSWLVSGPIDERAQTFAAADGVTYGLLTAGSGGREFDIPEMVVAAQRYSHRKVVVA